MAGKNASSAKMLELILAINPSIVHFQGHEPFKTVLLSNKKPVIPFLSNGLGAVGGLVSTAATKHKETASPLPKPVKQFAKSRPVGTFIGSKVN